MGFRRTGVLFEAERLVDLAPARRAGHLAMALGVSIATLRRVIKSEAGVSVREWRRGHGLALAKALLVEEPSRPIKEIAFRLGFSSPHAFARWFRRETAATPTSFRNGSKTSKAPVPGTRLAGGDRVEPSADRHAVRHATSPADIDV